MRGHNEECGDTAKPLLQCECELYLSWCVGVCTSTHFSSLWALDAIWSFADFTSMVQYPCLSDVRKGIRQQVVVMVQKSAIMGLLWRHWIWGKAEKCAEEEHQGSFVWTWTKVGCGIHRLLLLVSPPPN